MFDLISDTSASTGMFQKGTFLNEHRFQPGQVVTCATEKTDNAVRMFQSCDQTYGLMLAEPTSYRFVNSGDPPLAVLARRPSRIAKGCNQPAVEQLALARIAKGGGLGSTKSGQWRAF